MKRRTFIGSLLGVSTLCKTPQDTSLRGCEPLTSIFTGVSSYPLGGDYEGFFERVNGFEINFDQRKWLNKYNTTLLSSEPSVHSFAGARQTGVTTFAHTTILYRAICGKRVGIMCTHCEAKHLFHVIFKTKEVNNTLSQYSMRNQEGVPAFVRFLNGGSINFVSKQDLDALRGAVFDEIWANKDGYLSQCISKLPAELVTYSKHNFTYGTHG